MQEKVEVGDVKSCTYHVYVKSAGGYLVAALVFFTLFLNVGSSAFTSWWLAAWINAGGGVNIFIIRVSFCITYFLIFYTVCSFQEYHRSQHQ